MIDRLIPSFFRANVLAPSLRPAVHEPLMDRKTRADVRREILAKLTIRFKNLGIPNS
jgi:hypothetical protein